MWTYGCGQPWAPSSQRQPESEAAVKFAALLGRVVNVQRWIKGVGGGNVDGEEVDHQARAGRL
ncbi:hypothetical protein A0H81_01419 [Grifola frondosa]|uniref:Uncharacterized protein n=1 Tax=Grifola frondosa TaxID=5627 RepID=A0A1C7MT19_GRIFR|nr:hypothetical protein A0H81_01419 [Grifola frondosa]